MVERVNLNAVCYRSVFLFISIATIYVCPVIPQRRSPSVDFKRYTVVHPVVHHGRSRREIRSTRHTEGEHHKQVTVTMDVDGEEYVVDLQLNKELLAGDHVISYQKDGKTVLHKPAKQELDICQYSGMVRGKPGSWVAVSTCHGIRGVIHDGKTKYIEPAGRNEINARHFIYDHSDLNITHRCGYNGSNSVKREYDQQLLNKYYNEQRRKSGINRYKRETYDKVQEPYNANKQSRYVELVLVADNEEYIARGKNLAMVHHKLKDLANIVNSIYAPLNIFIALVGVVVWSEYDAIQIETNSTNTLNKFLQYRSTTLRKIPHDSAHLLTRHSFEGIVVGKAYVGTICSNKLTGGIVNIHSSVIGLVAATVAHEMGHNFGMEHDNVVACECPDEHCIMGPFGASLTLPYWSSCSLKSLALSFKEGIDYCLHNKPKHLLESSKCGNGFVEADEQCDCGLLSAAADSSPCTACCDPDTCMLRNNATCAVGACCDRTTCKPKTAGTVCRTADHDCDLPEYCTGYSGYCPMDVYKMDATPCGSEEGYCMQGECRTHLKQCRLLWGPSKNNADVRCYQLNTRGYANGHCGYQLVGNDLRYTPCQPKDAMCGQLQCVGDEFRMLHSMSYVNTKKFADGEWLKCGSVTTNSSQSDMDSGLVPDGAKCGKDMMCLNQRCMLVEMVKERLARTGSVCPSDCSGHGICNSDGNCHCDEGFGPPMCNTPGPGGSYDSGPHDTSELQNFKVAMYVIFLGVVPFVVIILIIFSKAKKMYSFRLKPCICLPKLFSSTTKSPTEIKNRAEDNKYNIQQSRRPRPQNFISYPEIRNNLPYKISSTKLSKDDIKVVGNSSILSNAASIRDPTELNPTLTSTTIETNDTTDIKVSDKVTLKNRNSSYTTSKEPNNSHRGETNTITHLNNELNNSYLAVKKQRKIDKNKLIIVNKGLSSTTNDTIVPTARKEITNNANSINLLDKLKGQINNSNETIATKSEINKGITNKKDVLSSGLSSTTSRQVNNERNEKDYDKAKSVVSATESQVKNLLRKFEQNKV